MKRLKIGVFSVYFGLVIALALFPPAYLATSGSRTVVLGLPFPIFYWIAIALSTGVGLWALYLAERMFGEIPEDAEAQ